MSEHESGSKQVDYYLGKYIDWWKASPLHWQMFHLLMITVTGGFWIGWTLASALWSSDWDSDSDEEESE